MTALLRGLASIVYVQRSPAASRQGDDLAAIYSDWLAVGDDLRSAIGKHQP